MPGDSPIRQAGELALPGVLTGVAHPEKLTLATRAIRPVFPSELLERSTPVSAIPPLPSSVLLPDDSCPNSPILSTSIDTHSRNESTTSNLARDARTRSYEQMTMSPVQPPSLLQQGVRQSSNGRSIRQEDTALGTTPSHSPSFSPRVPVATTASDLSSYLHPHKRQRTQQLKILLRPCIKHIRAHIASVGGMERLEPNVERPRFQLLERACEDDDLFYVALHQLVCIWDFNPNEITSIPGFPDIASLQIAFGHMGQLIKANGTLATMHKEWFARFPAPLADFLKSSEPYRNIVRDVGIFLRRLATDWDVMAKECIKRRYPPLVDELIGRLGLLSPILQGVFFRATVRNLTITDGEFASRMESLFKQDQQDHQSFTTRLGSNRPPGETENGDRIEKLKKKYLKIFQEFVVKGRELANPASASLTTGYPQFSGPQASQFQPQPVAPIQQPSSRPASMGDAAHWNQFSPPQQPQQLSMRRDGSYPGIATTVAQRSQHNTPSPVIAQGSTMASLPAQAFHQQQPQYHQINAAQIQQARLQQQQQQQQFQFQQQQQLQQYQAQGINTNLYQQQPNNNVYYQNPYQNPSYLNPTQNGIAQPVMRSQILPSMSTEQHQQWIDNQHRGQQQMPQYQRQQSQANLQTLNQGMAAMDQSLTRRQSLGQISQNLGQIGMPQATGVHSRTNSITYAAASSPVVASPQQFQPSSNQIPRLSHEQIQAQMDVINYPKIPVLQRPLVPPQGYGHGGQGDAPPFPAGWKAAPTALHQAHLRSPRLVAFTIVDSPQRYYQAVKKFALEPTKLKPSPALLQFNFDILESDLSLRPDEYIPGPGQVVTREFRHGSLQYRLRCIQRHKSKDQNSSPKSQWVVSDTYYPEGACLDINDRHLQIRRKFHHGKDMPIDITSLVRAGHNCLSISISRDRSTFEKGSYFVAVEVIEILEHAKVMEMCLSNRIPASTTLESIKKSLASPEDEDDDFAMAVGDLAIGLADPFTARIFETPVRGNTCLHRECFDLETFLTTRESKETKPKRSDQVKRKDKPTMIDVWKCPLCNGDARPYELRVDDFLVGVRRELEEKGMLKVNAIWIAPDGKWRPKIEEKTGVSSDESSDDEPLRDMRARKQSRASSNGRTTNGRRAGVEVITLDDD